MTTITDLDDFKALEPCVPIIEHGLDGTSRVNIQPAVVVRLRIKQTSSHDAWVFRPRCAGARTHRS